MIPRLLCAAFAAMLVPAASAFAGTEPTAPIALDATMGGAPLATDFTVASGAGDANASDGFAVAPPPAAPAWVGATRWESVRYRPRRGGYRDPDRYPRERDRYREPGYRPRGVAQLHAGFLDPDGPVEPGFVVGFRGGQKFDMVELGLGIDWRNKSGNVDEVLREVPGPGGETIVERRAISRFSSNLFPMMAYLQVSGPDNAGVIPYFGAAAAYEALFLSAEDFQTGESFDATYDGWGWQLWAGAGFSLGGPSRLVGEVFLNQATLDREVFDSASGETIRETIDADGFGGRFGIQWGF